MPDPTTFADRAGVDVAEGLHFAPKFDDKGLIPAVTTDHETGDVLMVAWMNEEALRKTIELGEAVYWSRSRKELWHKGATSGHVQKVVEMRVDCDQDVVWLRVDTQGKAACHVGYRSCFYRRVPSSSGGGGAVPLEYAGEEKVFDPKDVYGAKDKV